MKGVIIISHSPQRNSVRLFCPTHTTDVIAAIHMVPYEPKGLLEGLEREQIKKKRKEKEGKKEEGLKRRE